MQLRILKWSDYLSNAWALNAVRGALVRESILLHRGVNVDSECSNSIIPAQKRFRHEDHWKFKASLCYIVLGYHELQNEIFVQEEKLEEINFSVATKAGTRCIYKWRNPKSL